MLQQLALAMVPHEYDTVMGRRIVKMRQDALAQAAEPIVNNFFEMFREFGDEKGVEHFELLICAGDFVDAKDDLYELACKLEDIGPEFCANRVGIKLKRTSATDIRVYFAKRSDPAPQYASMAFNSNKDPE